MRKVDKLKQIEKANILAEQRHLESNSLVREDNSDVVNILDKIVMGAINMNSWNTEMSSHKEARLSRRYRNTICHEFDLEVSSTFKSFDINIKISRECDEDPEGASVGVEYVVTIETDGDDGGGSIGAGTGVDIKDKLTKEIRRQVNDLVDNIVKETISEFDYD